MSGTGPVEVMTLGEWQSPQPPAITRYFPRSMGEDSVLLLPQPASRKTVPIIVYRERQHIVACRRSIDALLSNVGNCGC